MKKLLLFCCLVFSACSTPETPKSDNKSELQAARDKQFAVFQKYVDAHYPNWKVKAIRLDGTETSKDETITKEFYYLLLTDGKAEKVVFVVSADFQLADGATETVLYMPVAETLKRMKEDKLKEKAAADEREKYEDRELPEPPDYY